MGGILSTPSDAGTGSGDVTVAGTVTTIPTPTDNPYLLSNNKANLIITKQASLISDLQSLITEAKKSL